MNYIHLRSFDGYIIALPARFGYLRAGLRWLARDYIQLPDVFILHGVTTL